MMKLIACFLIAVCLVGCARGKYVDRDPSGFKSAPTDLSLHGLFAGDAFQNYLFFENIADRPFDPNIADFDLINAWWCAESALLVYVPEEKFVRDALARAGFNDIDCFYRSGPMTGPDTQFFIAANEDAVLVSFRGSQIHVADWSTNSKFALTPFGHGRVHSGFLQALNEAWNDAGLGRRLERLYNEDPERPVWFTGHSLGGAVAMLAAARWFDAHTTSSGAVYTFGTPRAGDRAFGESISYPLWRVIHNTDLFPGLPPIGYRHAGGLKWIDPEGELHDDSGAKNITFVSNMKFFFSNLCQGRWVMLPRDVVDHSPLYYAIRLYNRVVDEVD